MMPLPPPLGDGSARLWRLDRARHALTWSSGEGSFLAGGRWNSRGRRVVYCALDPATAVLEVAVHKTFRVLDTDPHVLTSAAISTLSAAFVLQPSEVPNPNWLHPGVPSAGQQKFGDELMDSHDMVVVPSVVSRNSWNIIFIAERSDGLLEDVRQEDFALDPRLHPPA